MSTKRKPTILSGKIAFTLLVASLSGHASYGYVKFPDLEGPNLVGPGNFSIKTPQKNDWSKIPQGSEDEKLMNQKRQEYVQKHHEMAEKYNRPKINPPKEAPHENLRKSSQALENQTNALHERLGKRKKNLCAIM